MIFDHAGSEVGRHQLEHRQIRPASGYVEHDPDELWARADTVIRTALASTGLTAADLGTC